VIDWVFFVVNVESYDWIRGRTTWPSDQWRMPGWASTGRI
jgi:hypothetical protein